MIYVFHHIPKAGGKSCLAAFSEWFELVRDYRHGNPLKTPDAYPPRVDLDSLDRSKLLCGHWESVGNRIFERYPEMLDREDVRIITFLRDPMEVVMSRYYYGRRRHGNHLDKTIDEHLTDAEASNFVEKLLGCPRGGWRAHLERYWFVGVTERLQESFDVLAGLLGKPRVEVGVVNATDRGHERPSAGAVEAYRRESPHDLALYAYALERFGGARVEPAS